MATGEVKSYRTAKRRRDATTTAVMELADLLPLPSDTDIGKLKTNEILRLTVGYVRLKHMMKGKKRLGARSIAYGANSSGSSPIHPSSEIVSLAALSSQSSLPATIRPGSRDVLKALDGFLVVIDPANLDIVYVSESILEFLGVYMVDLIGRDLSSLVVAEDLDEVTARLSCQDSNGLYCCRTFFCHMRSAKGKRPNGRTRSPGQKLVHVTGRMQQFNFDFDVSSVFSSSRRRPEQDQTGKLMFVGTVRVVMPVPVTEPRFSTCLFTSRTTLELQIIKIDFTVAPELSSRRRQAGNGTKCQQYWHPDDLSWILESFDKLLKFGQAIWLVHRIMYKGQWAWIQAHSTVVKNKYIDNSVSLVSEEVGLRALELREPSTANPKPAPNRSLPAPPAHSQHNKTTTTTSAASSPPKSSESTAVEPSSSVTDWSCLSPTIPTSSFPATSLLSVASLSSPGNGVSAETPAAPAPLNDATPPSFDWSSSPEFDFMINDFLRNPNSDRLETTSVLGNDASLGHSPSASATQEQQQPTDPLFSFGQTTLSCEMTTTTTTMDAVADLQRFDSLFSGAALEDLFPSQASLVADLQSVTTTHATTFT